LIEGCEVLVGASAERLDVMEEGSAAMVCEHPVFVGLHS
jgi:hypothetical protein